MTLNEFQTPVTPELLKQYPEEVVANLFDLINNVPFIHSLINKDRQRACDRPRDEHGRIIVDLINPHILEDMDYFRETVLHYQQHGCFTKLRVNTSPQSAFMKWLQREIWRCWYGMVRPSDGEWITGDYYFHLNYTPILRVLKDPKLKGKKTKRVEDFPAVWEGAYWRSHYMHQAMYGGLYNDFKGGNHGGEIARRGAGKSYFAASMLTKNFLLGIDGDQTDKVKCVAIADNKEYLGGKDGLLSKFMSMINFLAETSQFPASMIKASLSDYHWISGFIEAETNIKKGNQNEVLGLATSDDSDKIRGKRCNIQIYEEFGAFPRFLDTWQTAQPNVEDGDDVFGFSYFHGTGGTTGSDFQGAIEMINHPEGYNVYGLPNVWDRASSGNKRTLFFFPEYVNRSGSYNKDGVSDVTDALLKELMRVYILKYNSSDLMSVTRRKAEHPLTLQDAIMRVDSVFYPTAQINDRLNQLDSNPTLLDDMYIGRFTIDKGKVIYVPDSDVRVIMQYPHKDNKMDGAIHINAMPECDLNGNVYSDRYIAGADVVDTDGAATKSLFAGYILDLWTDNIVFEYVGRPLFVDDSYEIWRQALLFYNARCNYENNKKGLFSHFSKMNSLYLLTDTLEFLKDKDMAKPGVGNAAKGTTATQPVKAYARTCITKYLLKPYTEIRIDDNGNEISNAYPNLFRIKYRALLQELSLFNLDDNFDRHDGFAMLMLLREDKLRLLGDKSFQDRENERSGSELSNDDFFNRNYHAHRTDKAEEQYRKALLKLGLIKETKDENTNN